MDPKIVKLKKELKEKNVRGLALDIDETLSDTNTHWLKRMFEFHMPENFTKEEILENYKFVQDVPAPGWKTEEAFEFMNQMVHSNEFNESIPLIIDSNHIIKEINKIVPMLIYITARPETVIDGTIKWLDKHGFPKAEIITQSAKVKASDEYMIYKNVWKASVLKYLSPEIIGIVDDNYGLAGELEKLDYKGTHYLYGKQSAQIKNHKNNVVVCQTWQDVLKAVIKNTQPQNEGSN